MPAVPAVPPLVSNHPVVTGKGGVRLFLGELGKIVDILSQAWNTSAKLCWYVDEPMSCVRKDLLKRHGEFVMHCNAEDCETTLAQSQHDGGIRMAFEKGIAAQRVAV